MEASPHLGLRADLQPCSASVLPHSHHHIHQQQQQQQQEVPKEAPGLAGRQPPQATHAAKGAGAQPVLACHTFDPKAMIQMNFCRCEPPSPQQEQQQHQ